jgi:hypothetical protein
MNTDLKSLTSKPKQKSALEIKKEKETELNLKQADYKEVANEGWDSVVEEQKKKKKKRNKGKKNKKKEEEK